MFPLFETICVHNSSLLHLHWHQKRVDAAFKAFFKTPPPQLSSLIEIPSGYNHGWVKCRFLYNDTEWKTEFSAYTTNKVKNLNVIDGGVIEYEHKFTDRKALTTLFDQKGDCDDILIVKDGFITDTSISNIIFYNGKEWHTPSTPLLKGTCRERLLNQHIIAEKDIRVRALINYSHFMLINAMNDFSLSRVKKTSNLQINLNLF